MAVGKASILRAVKAQGLAVPEASKAAEHKARTDASVLQTARSTAPATALQCPQIALSQIITEEVRLTRAFLASVRSYGIIEPVLLYQTAEGYRILRGRRRVAAAFELGLETVPAVVVEADAARVRLLHRELTAFERGQDAYRGGNEAVYAIGENQMPEFLL